MSSVNEQLAPPPKPRISPLEFRNTDLVSRLLAATPPYLYNMSLLPNTYFFSEMLRSFVQAKSDSSNRNFQTRRTRKRPWTSLKNDTSASIKIDQTTDWSLKNNYVEHKSESPLELTTDSDKNKNFSPNLPDRKIEMPLSEQMEPLYSSIGQESGSSGLILPPPPPIWYPPLYPTTPYGIDPLHFFIDLRVSGHIYDRKNQREESSTKSESDEKKQSTNKESVFKQSRHTSAFSVPTPRLNRSGPINLSHNEEYPEYNTAETKNIKFDVKSMGFDKTCNRIGTSYIMNNINNIYKNVTEESQQKIKNENSSETISTNENDNETEEERQKRVKDLRALIGLELVVDYMNHAKPQPKRLTGECFTDSESIGSPTVEVVAVQDET